MIRVVTSDEALHEADYVVDADIIGLPEVHVHGLSFDKDQQIEPVPQATPWPAIPSSLESKSLNDWVKAGLLVSKDAHVTVGCCRRRNTGS